DAILHPVPAFHLLVHRRLQPKYAFVEFLRSRYVGDWINGKGDLLDVHDGCILQLEPDTFQGFRRPRIQAAVASRGPRWIPFPISRRTMAGFSLEGIWPHSKTVSR